MLIRHCMTRDVTVIPARVSCMQTWRKFGELALRRAPVVDERGRVMGMITERDLLRVLPWTLGDLESKDSERDPTRPVGEVARRELLHVGPDEHLEVAARMLLDHRIGGLPVLEEGELVGIVTESDLFRVFAGRQFVADTTRLTLQWQGSARSPVDPCRLAVACGVELRELWRHESPEGHLLLDVHAAGNGVADFQERLLAAGFLLLDRRSPADQHGS